MHRSASLNKLGKTTRDTWDAKIFIALVLAGCAGSISTLVHAIMEEL